ncbi:MAG: amidohydrolase family protein [Candidatus Izemoplasmatales bacterium]
MTAVVHANLFDFISWREDAYVRFDDRIRAVGPMSEYVPGTETVVDARGAILMPGLVLGHTHVYSAFARGMSVPFAPQGFQDILDQLWWKLDRNLDLEAVHASGAAAAADYLRNGVTAIVDHHASGAIDGSLAALGDAIVDVAGMRAAFCFETSDRFDVDACIRENLAFSKRVRPGRSAAMFGLHASMSLGDDTLRRVAAVRGDLPVHVHAAESAEDVAMTRSRHGTSVVERFDRFGMVGPGSLYVHCVHCDERELSLLKARGATVAVNPTSNMNNGVGLPDVAGMLARGIPTILGDDGMSASAAVEIRALGFSMNHRDGMPTAFGLADTLRVVLNTYDFMSSLFGIRLGRIEPDAAADLLVADYPGPTPIGPRNAFGHFVFGMAPAFRPRHVFVNGRQVVADFTLDDPVAAAAAGSREKAQAVWDRLAREGEQR